MLKRTFIVKGSIRLVLCLTFVCKAMSITIILMVVYFYARKMAAILLKGLSKLLSTYFLLHEIPRQEKTIKTTFSMIYWRKTVLTTASLPQRLT